ncbi:unnamed protein product [Sphagnum balticum]
MEIERRKRNLVFTDETFTLFVVASVAATSRFGRLEGRRSVVVGGRPTRIEEFAERIPASVVQVLRSFGPDLSLNAERSYQHFGISSSSFRHE